MTQSDKLFNDTPLNKSVLRLSESVSTLLIYPNHKMQLKHYYLISDRPKKVSKDEKTQICSGTTKDMCLVQFQVYRMSILSFAI